MNYIYIVLGIILIPLLANIYVRTPYKKYLQVDNRNGLSGFEVARKILDSNELESIHIVETRGNLTDHYDPGRNVIRLSSEVFNKNSISSVAISAHECGHAIQNKEGYIFMKIRNFLVPIVNLVNKFAYIILIIGIILEYYGLIELAIILMSSSVLFQLITLPVEINASSKAKKELEKLNILNENELKGSSKVLTAAAFTYIAGLLSSILQLLRLVLIFGNNND